MKRILILCVMLCSLLLPGWANNGCEQHLTPEQFRARQQAFITEKAELTPAEAEKFFPLYFEMQGRKKMLNDKIMGLYRRGKDEKTSEKHYQEILEAIYDLHDRINDLEESYFEKFKQVISYKKIYLVQRAEMKFHRSLLKGMKQDKAKPKPTTSIKNR